MMRAAFLRAAGAAVLASGAGAALAGQPAASRPAPGAAAPRLLAIRYQGKYGYIDSTGKLLIEPKYDMVDGARRGGAATVDDLFADGMMAVRIGHLWGYIDRPQKLVIPPRFGDAERFHGGLAVVRVGDKYGVIDRQGRFVAQPKYTHVAPFRQRMARVAAGGHRLEGGLPGGKWGFIDAGGREVVPPKYDYANDFGAGGVAAVNVGGAWTGRAGLSFSGGKWGAIDRTGRELVQPRYEFAERGGYGRANLDLPAGALTPVKVGGKFGFIDEFWKLVVAARYDAAEPFSGGRAAVRAGELWGYVDAAGTEVIAPCLDAAGCFSEGLAAARRKGQLFYIDAAGRTAFAVAGGRQGLPFRGAVAAVDVAGKWGFVDKQGAFVQRPQFDLVRPHEPGLTLVRRDGKCGLVDAAGKLILPPRFDWIGGFGPDGRALVGLGPTGRDAAIGVIDRTGKVLAEPRYGRSFDAGASPEADGKWTPRPRGRLWGFVGPDGEAVVPAKYTAVEGVGRGLVAVKDAKLNWGLVDTAAGKVVFEPRYYQIGRFSEGLAPVQPLFRGPMGYMDRTGRIVVPARYAGAEPFRDGVACVNMARKGGRDVLWIDRTGRFLWPRER